MRVFWEIARLSIRRQFAYRAANLAGLVTNLFFGLLRASVMIALYRGRDHVDGITLAGAVTFTALSQGVIAFLTFFSMTGGILQSVHTGEVGSDLLKPMPMIGYWMARDFGVSVVGLILRGATILLAYAIFFPIVTPGGWSGWTSFLLVLLLAWLVSFSIRFLVGLYAFWSPNAEGFARFASSVSLLLSGFLMPLRFFPDWFTRFCEWTPFPSTLNSVVEVYLGIRTGSELLTTILTQIAWCAALLFAGAFALRAGIRRLVIQGG